MNTTVDYLKVGEDDDGMRLDRWFKKHVSGVRQGQIEKALRKGQIRVDGGRAKASTRLEAGQSIRIPPFDVSDAPLPARPKPLDHSLVDDLKSAVLHMDDHVLVLNKPAGLAVQGGTNTRKHVDGALPGLCFGFPEKPRLVHRLDKDTSGVLVLGRTAQAARILTKSFQGRDVNKVYWAVTVGVPSVLEGTVKAPLDKRPGRGGERVMVADDGKYAETDFEVLDRAGRRAAVLALSPKTGRTHQLRVHCADVLETPIMGDGKYGGEDAFIDGVPFRALHLHARQIDVPHPNGGRLVVQAPLSKNMRATLAFLGLNTISL